MTHAKQEIGVVVHFEAKPGKEAELLKLMTELLEPTRKEPGCLRYELNQEIENSAAFTFVEKFISRQDFETHVKQSYSARFGGLAEPLIQSKKVRLSHELLATDAAEEPTTAEAVIIVAHFPARAGKRQVAKGQTAARAVVATVPGKQFEASVYGFAVSGETLFAATTQGVLRSVSSGTAWVQVASVPMDEWRFAAASKGVVAVASLNTLEMSADGGKTWQAAAVPSRGRQLSALAVDGEGELWVADRDGVYYSANRGASWQTVKGMFLRDGNNIFYDEAANRMLVTSNGPATVAFAVAVPSMQVRWWDTGWNLRFVRPVGDYLVGATLFDGIVVQPRMVDSAELETH